MPAVEDRVLLALVEKGCYTNVVLYNVIRRLTSTSQENVF
jgi:hypothetical protein